MTAIDDLKTAVRSYSTDRVATEIVDFSISSGATLNVYPAIPLEGRRAMQKYVGQPRLNAASNMPTVILPTTAARSRAPVRAVAADDYQHLFSYITAHQHACRSYLSTTKPRSAAWTLTNIVSSALAAAVAAGPTFGGSAFMDLIYHALDLPKEFPVGQIMCAIVFAIAVVSTITANIINARDYATKIATAEACYGALDALRVELQFGALNVARGAQMAAKEISRTPFVIHSKTPQYPTA